MTEIKGKWALVTGASRGMGRQAALFLAQKGCNLALHSRKPAHTATLLEEVRALGVEAYCVEAELSDLAQVSVMLDAIERKGTPIDIVLNNAAVQIAYRSDWLATPPEDYTTSFTINTIAPMMICYRLLPGMQTRGFGRIVNTTSGIDREPQQAGYSASKAALDKVTKDLGTTVEGTDVIISLTDPGWCRTDLGGPNAPNSVESAMPGIVVGVFVNDGKSGRIFHAQDFSGLSLDQAVAKAEAM